MIYLLCELLSQSSDRVPGTTCKMAAEREPGLHVRIKDAEGTLKLTDGRLRSHALSELCRTLMLPLDMSVLGLALPSPGGPIVPAYMLAAFAAASDSTGGTWDAVVGAPTYSEHPIAAPPYLPCAFDWLHLAALDMPPAHLGAKQLLAACHTSVEVYRAFALCGYTVIRGSPGSTAIAALAQQHARDYFADESRADRRELELGRNKFAGYSRQGARQLLQLRAVRFSGAPAEQSKAYETGCVPPSSKVTQEGEPCCLQQHADVLKAALLPGRFALSTADAEDAAGSIAAAEPPQVGLSTPSPAAGAMAHSFTAAFDMLDTLARLLLRVVALGLACELRGALSGVTLAASPQRPCLVILHERCCSHLCGLLDAVAPPWRVGAVGEPSSRGAAAGTAGHCASDVDTAPSVGVAGSTLSQPLAPGVAHVGADVLRVYQYYRPPDSELPGVSGAATGIHCDMGLLTVSPRSSLPGLRVLHPGTMQWMDVETDMGEHDLAAFAGECLPRAVATLRAQLLREGPSAFQRGWPAAETPPCACGCQDDDAASAGAPPTPPLPTPALPAPLDLPRAPLHYVDERFPGAPRISTPFFLRARPEAAFADGLAVAAFVEGEVMRHRPWRKRAASAAGAAKGEGSGSEGVAPDKLAVRASQRGTDY